MFGAGGGTSSYREAEDADLLILWGSNARDAHPIFFHHVLKGVRNGARLYAVDPRRTSSAQWADAWLGIDVGSDISLANAIGREIIQAGLVNEAFVRRATSGFDAYAASVEAYPLDRAERETGVPGDLIRQLAHDYARADRAQICWTLGITEHHNAADNVFALINLALLTGHVGRYGSGLVPLRGQNNVQGGGDMGAIPNKLSGFQDLETDLAARARFEAAYGAPVPPRRGWHLSLMFEAMERGELTACYIIGENPLRSEADTGRARKLLEGLEHFVVQDMFLTDTAKLASVVLPATATWCEAEGTVTSSERRVQRVRQALEPPPGARDDIQIICEIARRLGADWGKPSAEDLWNELRTLSPMHAGMSYRRLEELGGISTMFFSHRDDVADHEKFHEHFGCRRIIHTADARGIETEQLLEGQEAVTLGQDLTAIPVPGHTRGHVVLLYRDKYLFTGDHLAWSEKRGGLVAFRDVAWYSWREQTQSMKRLLDYRFEWVLPGHGRRAHQPSDIMHRKLVDCVQWMEGVA